MIGYEVIEIDERTDREEVIFQSLDYEEAFGELIHNQLANIFDYIHYEMYIYEF